jgi:alcohol dehydrogenase class IV
MWFFTSPRLVFGPGAVEFLSSVPAKRALIICDRDLAKRGVPDRLVEQLAKGGGEVKIFGDVEPEPLVATAQRAAEMAKEFGPDYVIGLGGGSAMDVAKAAYTLYERPDLTVYDITPLVELRLGKKAKLIQVPTTSGTGSETTWATILTEGPGGRKLELANRELVAEWAILDSLLATTMPPRLTADTGADALCHAVEAISSDWSNPFSDACAKEAVATIFRSLPKVVKEGGNAEAREEVHYAASMGGLAFGNAQVGVGHALGHSLGSVFKIPHGRSVGIFLPYAIEFNFASATEKFRQLAGVLGEGPVRSGRELSAHVRKLWDAIGMSRSISSLGTIKEADFEKAMPELVTRADQSTCVSMNPRVPSTAELERLFRAAWSGGTVDF